MKVEEHQLEVKRHLRFYSTGNISSKKLVVVLHGYGQLAKFFIRKFFILQEDYVILAPEGMHRYYLEGSSGRVGASWMTKEDRLNDIKDNNRMLEQLLESVCREKEFEEISVVGFSQGGATAARFCAESKIKLNTLILWASIFPEDLEEKMDQLRHLERKFVLGRNDEYFSDQNQEKAIKYYSSIGFEFTRYTGNHDIEPTVLQSLFL